jgi:hypothetical protein
MISNWEITLLISLIYSTKGDNSIYFTVITSRYRLVEKIGYTCMSLGGWEGLNNI